MMKNRLLLLLVLLVCLTLTSCTQQTPTIQPTQTPTPTPELPIAIESIELVKGFAAAWGDQDAEALMPYYSKDVKAFDADSYGTTYNYSTVAFAVNSLLSKGEFYFDVSSFFVTGDGRFAALVGSWFTLHPDGYTAVPALTLIEIDSGLVVWEYDYYAGNLSEMYSVSKIPLTASEVRLAEAELSDLESELSEWMTAINDEDLEAIAPFYSEDAAIIIMIAPEWLKQTKTQFTKILERQFADESFNTTLEEIFISANGQFTVVQGILEIVDREPQPIIMLLELADGQITQQFIYLDKAILYPFYE